MAEEKYGTNEKEERAANGRKRRRRRGYIGGEQGGEEGGKRGRPSVNRRGLIGSNGKHHGHCREREQLISKTRATPIGNLLVKLAVERNGCPKLFLGHVEGPRCDTGEGKPRARSTSADSTSRTCAPSSDATAARRASASSCQAQCARRAQASEPPWSNAYVFSEMPFS